ncbi:DUF1489 family protein [Pseudooceanicola sp. C21-150M6]|uniref:DUF1489 family protein n=1 Tax=Pseudooceanicola sp. C21-150M6 TaxID=3434355 RepID=UPI003D7F581A
MGSFTNILKLSVGTESMADLAAWQSQPIAQTTDGLPRHVTRMWPKREGEIISGGSIYWVIKGMIQCRQRVIRLDEVDRGDGIRRCAIVLDPELHATAASPRRPFQGWRYLKPEDSPPDLPKHRQNEDALPEDLSKALAEIGVL